MSTAVEERRDAAGRWRRWLDGMVRRPVLTTFVIAFVARAGLAIAVRILSNGSLALDDESYVVMATEWVNGQSGQWDDYTEWLFGQTRTFLLPIVGLFAILGADPLWAQLFTAVLGSAAAAMVVVILRRSVSAPYPLVGGVVVALLPEQVIYSATPFKDPAVWLLLAVSTYAMVRAVESVTYPSLLLWSGAFLLSAVLLRGVRAHTVLLVFVAGMLTAIVARGGLTKARVGIFAVLLVAGPYVLGLGAAGSYVVQSGGDLAQRRFNNAVLAESAFVETQPEDDQTADGGPPEDGGAGSTDGGPGSEDSAAISDAGETSQESADSGLGSDLRHVPVGLSYVLGAPFPWQTGGSRALQLGRLGSLVWYPVLLLALVGFAVRSRSREAMVWYPALVSGGVLLVYALTEGNVGTAQRHRGEVMWAAAILAVMAVRWWRGRRAAEAAT